MCAAVPAVVDLCVTLLKQYGTISFEEAVKRMLSAPPQHRPAKKKKK